MARPHRLRERVPNLASLPLAEALTKAFKFLQIEREGATSEAAIAASERELGVAFPADYRAFLRAGGGLTALGDPRFGLGRLTVFGVDQLGDQRNLLREWYPDCAVVPLLLLGDAVEQGAFGVGLNGKPCWVHAKDNEIDVAGTFESELVESLGEVIIVDEEKKAGRTPRFAVATFATSNAAHLFLARLGEADVRKDALDFIDKADANKLTILPIAAGRQILVIHPGPKRFDEARFAAHAKEAEAAAIVSTNDRTHVTVRSKTHRGLGDLDRVFSAATSDWAHAIVGYDTYLEPPYKTPLAQCQCVLQLVAKTVGRTIGLVSGDAACAEFVRAMLTLIRDKAAKDWEFEITSRG